MSLDHLSSYWVAFFEDLYRCKVILVQTYAVDSMPNFPLGYPKLASNSINRACGVIFKMTNNFFIFLWCIHRRSASILLQSLNSTSSTDSSIHAGKYAHVWLSPIWESTMILLSSRRVTVTNPLNKQHIQRFQMLVLGYFIAWGLPLPFSIKISNF